MQLTKPWPNPWDKNMGYIPPPPPPEYGRPNPADSFSYQTRERRGGLIGRVLGLERTVSHRVYTDEQVEPIREIVMQGPPRERPDARRPVRNCRNCGAPPLTNRLTCDYCGSVK